MSLIHYVILIICCLSLLSQKETSFIVRFLARFWRVLQATALLLTVALGEGALEPHMGNPLRPAPGWRGAQSVLWTTPSSVLPHIRGREWSRSFLLSSHLMMNINLLIYRTVSIGLGEPLLNLGFLQKRVVIF